MALCRFSDGEVYCFESIDGAIEFQLMSDPFDSTNHEIIPIWSFVDYEEAAQFAERLITAGVPAPGDLAARIRALV